MVGKPKLAADPLMLWTLRNNSNESGLESELLENETTICSTLPSRSTTSSMKKGRSSATRSESISCSLVICCPGMEDATNIQGGLRISILVGAAQPSPHFI